MRAPESIFITLVAASLLSFSTMASAQDTGGQTSTAPTMTPKMCAESFERGQVEEAGQKYVAAKSDFLACSQQTCPQAIVKECIQLLDTVRRETPSVGFHVSDGTGKELLDVQVKLDDKLIMSRIDATLHEVNPGVHKVEMRASGFKPYTENIPIYVGERGRIISVELVPIAAQTSAGTLVSAPTAPSQPSTNEPPPHGPGAWPWIMVGTGGAALAVGAVFGLAAIHQHDVACPAPDTNRCSKNEYDKGLREADLSTVFFAAGGALVGGGLLWHFLAHPKETTRESNSTSNVSLTIGYRSLGLRGHFE